MASALPFSAFGKEERDVGHRGGEVAAAEAAQQRQREEDPVGRVRDSAPHSPCRCAGISSDQVESVVHSRPPKIAGMKL